MQWPVGAGEVVLEFMSGQVVTDSQICVGPQLNVDTHELPMAAESHFSTYFRNAFTKAALIHNRRSEQFIGPGSGMTDFLFLDLPLIFQFFRF